MPLNRKAAIIGTSIMAPSENDDLCLEELLFEVSQAALKDAGLTMEDIDGIVVAANDQFDGRAISVMAASGSVGGVDRDILSTPSASEHALVMGALRISSGQYETHLIVSWSPTEASSLAEVERLGADPYFHRALPLDERSAAALQATAISAAVPGAYELAQLIVTRNRENGKRAYGRAQSKSAGADASTTTQPAARWPLSDDMPTAPVTGAVALVISSEDFVKRKGLKNYAVISGLGWATEAAFLGDRDLATAPALAEAARRAYAEGHISNPREAFDLAELSDATPYQELLAYEALGLSDRGSWQADLSAGSFDRGGRLPVNPSGGISTVNPVFCTGLIRIAEAANQVRGKANGHQVEGARSALAHAASGFAMMYQTVVVLGSQFERASA